MKKPLMPKATAVWLIENTTLSFEQISQFCQLHELEVQGIADGDVATGMQGYDPVDNNQLTKKEIARCEKDPKAILKLISSNVFDNIANLSIPLAHTTPGISGPPNNLVKPSYLPPPIIVFCDPISSDLNSKTV